MLSILSEQLSSELAQETYAPILRRHPFFECIGDDMKVVLMRICHVALATMPIAFGDMIFHCGDIANQAFIMKDGTFRYTLPDNSHVSPPLSPGEWIAEAVLWTPWRYRGDCYAQAAGELILVKPAHFAEVMSLHPVSWLFVKCYAELFLQWLNSLERSGEITDVVREEGFHNRAVHMAYQSLRSQIAERKRRSSDGPRMPKDESNKAIHGGD